MNPAKNRERKCSTCRHYQPSPLWRKGWCRNPLLYDRNTNHLVEADSLACNRTFIDYWEPIVGAQPAAGPQPHSAGKPRIAPSIPMTTTDPTGRRGITTGNTPAAGMAALAATPPLPSDGSREVPKLSLVTPDYDPSAPEVAPYIGAGDSKATRQIEQIEGPQVPQGTEGPQGLQGPETPRTAAQRIRQAR